MELEAEVLGVACRLVGAETGARGDVFVHGGVEGCGGEAEAGFVGAVCS